MRLIHYKDISQSMLLVPFYYHFYLIHCFTQVATWQVKIWLVAIDFDWLEESVFNYETVI